VADIRRATHDDLDQMVAMCEALHAESPEYRGQPFLQEKTRRSLAMAIGPLLGRSVNHTVVAEQDGVIVGMLAGYVTESFFCDVLFASDYVFYVSPAARGRMTAARLVRAFEAWARERGAAKVVPSISSGLEMDRTYRFYIALGYKPAGMMLSKEIAG